VFALRLIAAVLNKAIMGIQTPNLNPSSRTPTVGEPKEVDWQAVWAYALGPEPQLVLTLRLALDDKHTTVVVACSKALQAILSYSANEAISDLHEVLTIPWHFGLAIHQHLQHPSFEDTQSPVRVFLEGVIGSTMSKHMRCFHSQKGPVPKQMMMMMMGKIQLEMMVQLQAKMLLLVLYVWASCPGFGSFLRSFISCLSSVLASFKVNKITAAYHLL
jgi:hypothetical protein